MTSEERKAKELWSIYTLTCPLSGEVVYGGLTKSPSGRLKDHSRLCKGDSALMSEWKRSLVSQRLKPLMTVVSTHDTKEAAQEAERELLARLKPRLNTMLVGRHMVYRGPGVGRQPLTRARYWTAPTTIVGSRAVGPSPLPCQRWVSRQLQGGVEVVSR